MNKSFFALLFIFFSAEFIEPTKVYATRRPHKNPRKPRVVGVKKEPVKGTKRKSGYLAVQVRRAQKRLERFILRGSPRDDETVELNNAFDKGARVDVKDTNGNNLLHFVKSCDYAQWLINNECDCNQKNSKGHTPFQHHLLDRLKKNAEVPSCSPLFALTEWHVKNDEDPEKFLNSKLTRKNTTKTVRKWLENSNFALLDSSIDDWLKARKKK